MVPTQLLQMIQLTDSMQGTYIIWTFYINYTYFRVFVLPHIQKRAKGGEDAAVLTERLLGVADGVGGWIESGVDPAIFARSLCRK